MNYIYSYIYYPKKRNSHLKILPQFPFSCRPIQVQDDQVSRLVWVHLHHKNKNIHLSKRQTGRWFHPYHFGRLRLGHRLLIGIGRLQFILEEKMSRFWLLEAPWKPWAPWSASWFSSLASAPPFLGTYYCQCDKKLSIKQVKANKKIVVIFFLLFPLYAEIPT